MIFCPINHLCIATHEIGSSIQLSSFINPEPVPYQITELLGKGGFGEVYRVNSYSNPDQALALKCVRLNSKLGSSRTKELVMFIKEAYIGVCIGQHPHVTTLLDATMLNQQVCVYLKNGPVL